jgi:tubulin-specific chaperone A
VRVCLPMPAPFGRLHPSWSSSQNTSLSLTRPLHRAALHRLHKELQVYRDEADKTRNTIEKMEKDAAADEYEIRQQVRASERAAAVVDVRADLGDSSQRRVLAESERIIPDSEQRLAKAIDDLEDLLVRPRSVRCSLANPDLTLTRNAARVQDSTEDSHGASEEYKKASAAIKLVRPE